MTPEQQVSHIVNSTDVHIRRSVIGFFSASFEAMLTFYEEAWCRNHHNPKENAAQMAIAAARIAAMCESAGNFFAVASAEHCGLSTTPDKHAADAAKAAIPVVRAMIARKVAQWTEEAQKKED